MSPEERVEELETKFEAFLEDAKDFKNKSAARRARKASLDIAAGMKEYRKESIK